MHVDDLTLVTAAQLLEDDNLYVGRPGDPDPDRRTTLAHLAGRILGDIPDDLDDLEGRVDQLEDDVAALAIELGSNANGTYVRLENGLQACWFQSGTETPTSGQTVAPWYHTDVTAFTFPAAFADIPAVMPTSRTASNGLGVTVTGASTGSCSLRGWGVNSGQWVRFGYVAVGRWK